MEVILVKAVVTCVLVIVFLLTVHLTPWFFGVSRRHDDRRPGVGRAADRTAAARSRDADALRRGAAAPDRHS